MGKIRKALVSVFDKAGLAALLEALREFDIDIISTGGTQASIESLGHPVTSVESLTG